MSTTSITLAGNPVTLVTLPTSPGFRTVEFSHSNAVAVVTSIFTGQTQTQHFPGADQLSCKVTLPPLTQAQADAWIAALMQCQGMTNAIQIGDPLKITPRGNPVGAPTVDTSQAMAAGTNVLYTYGWQASSTSLLLPGDYLQIGFRIHRVLDQVNSGGDGKAAINIWPSLRETPSGVVITSNAKGLFRLANNKNTWSADYTLLSSISFDVIEYR
jgi:hypothetical protein